MKQMSFRGLRVRLVIAVTVFSSFANAQDFKLVPPCSGAEFRQLDFWAGEWDLEFTKPDGSTGRAENSITANEFGSCVIAEHFRLPGGGPDGTDYIGASHSMFDSAAGVWRQTWVDNGGNLYRLRGGPVTGQPHIFELVTEGAQGPRRETLRMIWQDVTPASLTWRWQARDLNNQWQDRWVLKYRRRGTVAAAP